MKIQGERIYIKLLSPDDINQSYVEWMQDYETIEFLDSKWKVYTLDDLKSYVKHMNESPNDFLFGIFLITDNRYIGNIKIGSINQIHRFGDLGLLIGEKDCLGKGLGTESIELATKYAFEELNLNKLTAGMYINNIGSYKSFIKAGYREVGKLMKHKFIKGEYQDVILVEKIKSDR
jgi:ribosomal-protein-alanine N-acetyltransferase